VSLVFGDVSDVSRFMMTVEEKLRDYASQLQGYVGGRPVEVWVERARRGVYNRQVAVRVLGELEDFMDRVEESVERIKSGMWAASNIAEEERLRRVERLLSGLSSVREFMRSVEEAYRRKCRVSGHMEVECEEFETDVYKEFIDNIREELGRTCGNLVATSGEVTLPALIDGLSNCVHVVAEEAAKIAPERVEGFCSLTGGYPDTAVEFCRAWHYFVREIEDTENYYAESDRRGLFGFVVGSEGNFRVGDMPTHSVKFNFSSGAFRYYDPDMNVNRVVESLLKRGVNCNCVIISNVDSVDEARRRGIPVDNDSDGVACVCPTDRESVVKLAYVVSRITSLDVNYEELYTRYRERIAEMVGEAFRESGVIEKIKEVLESREFKEGRYEEALEKGEKIIKENVDKVIEAIEEKLLEERVIE